MICSRCKGVLYCEPHCQRDDWSKHKEACEVLENLEKAKNALMEKWEKNSRTWDDKTKPGKERRKAKEWMNGVKNVREYGNLMSCGNALMEDRFKSRLSEILCGHSMLHDCFCEVFGAESGEVATSLIGIANMHQSLGEYATAMNLYQRSLKIAEKVSGPESEEVASALNNMAIVHKLLGEYVNGLARSDRALKIKKKVFGSESGEVATTLNNMANMLQALGDYGKAMDLHEVSLKIRETVHGSRSPEVGMCLNGMAIVHQLLGDYAKAMDLYERSLKIYERVYGAEGVDVATSLNNLAGVYHSLGKHIEAMNLFERSLKIREKVFGEESQEVASCLNNMANAHELLGEYRKAFELRNKYLFSFGKVFGLCHSKYCVKLFDFVALVAYREDLTVPIDLVERIDHVIALDNNIIEQRKPNMVCLHRHLQLLVMSAMIRKDGEGVQMLVKNAAFLRKNNLSVCGFWLMKRARRMQCHDSETCQEEYHSGHLDEDVRGELERLKEVAQEVQEGLMESMGGSVGSTFISGVTRNRMCEYFSNALHVMDKVFQRFAKQCFDEVKGGDVYFPVVGAKTLLDNYFDQKKLIDIDKVFPEAYKVLCEVQPFTSWEGAKSMEEYRNEEWLQKVHCIGNDSKHLRLTPQGAMNQVDAAKDGLIADRNVVVQIDYLEGYPQLHDWSMVEGLGGWMEWNQARSLSTVLGKSLRKDKRYFELVHGVEKYYVVAKELRKRVFGDNKKEVEKLREELKIFVKEKLPAYVEGLAKKEPDYYDQLKRELPGWIFGKGDPRCEEERLCEEVFQFVKSRLMRHDVTICPAEAIPDFRVDAIKLMQRTMEGVERLADVLFQAIRQKRGMMQKLAAGVLVGKGKPEERDAIARKTAKEYVAAGRMEEAGGVWIREAEQSKHDGWLRDRYEKKACEILEHVRSVSGQAKYVKLMVKRAVRAHELGCYGIEQQLWAGVAARRKYCSSDEVDGLIELHDMEKIHYCLLSRKSLMDEDMEMQLVHCREQMETIKYESFRMVCTRGEPRWRLVRMMCMIGEVMVKLRHLLDQGLTRFSRECIGLEMDATPLQCKFVMGGSEERVLQEICRQLMHEEYAEVKKDAAAALDKKIGDHLEKHYADVVKAIMECQPFAYQDRWLEEVFQISNSFKHVKLNVPSVKELEELRVKGEYSITLPFDVSRFYGWSFACVFRGAPVAEDRVKLSGEVVEHLGNQKLLDKGKGNVGTKDLQEIVSKDDLMKRIESALTKPKKGKGMKLTQDELAQIRDILWRHAQMLRGEDDRDSERIVAVSLLERALGGVEKVLTAMFVAIRRKQNVQQYDLNKELDELIQKASQKK